MSVANNHTYDYKARGLAQTQAQLKANKIAYTGMAGQITVRRVKGIRVALIGFSPYSRNNNVNDIANAQRLVKRAAKRADVVVVVAHLGAEGVDKRHTPRPPSTPTASDAAIHAPLRMPWSKPEPTSCWGQGRTSCAESRNTAGG